VGRKSQPAPIPKKVGNGSREEKKSRAQTDVTPWRKKDSRGGEREEGAVGSWKGLFLEKESVATKKEKGDPGYS